MIVVVEGEMPEAAGEPEPFVARHHALDMPAASRVALQRQPLTEVVVADAGVAEGEDGLGHLARRVVSDDDDFEVLMGLVEDRGKRAGCQQLRAVKRGDRDRHERVAVAERQFVFGVASCVPQAMAVGGVVGGDRAKRLANVGRQEIVDRERPRLDVGNAKSEFAQVSG